MRMPAPAALVVAALLLPAGCASPRPRGEREALQALLPKLQAGQPYLAYIEADGDAAWFAEDLMDKAALDRRLARYAAENGLVIPVFPTVYSPGSPYLSDRVYYNFILNGSGIKPGDKVLVVGCGSGSDAWAAWLKSRSRVYAVDINPLAVANTKATAQIAGFPVEAVQGDIASAELPADFAGFDHVLWNMPFFRAPVGDGSYRHMNYQDGDDGAVLDAFLGRLPRLLKKGGQAVILNSAAALGRIPASRLRVVEKDERQFLGVLSYP